jgi:hypothetical protein
MDKLYDLVEVSFLKRMGCAEVLDFGAFVGVYFPE